MQIPCERSNVGSDVRCGVCGQGFLVYWERTSRAGREAAKADVMRAIREHHEDMSMGHHAHPVERFTVPSWSGDTHHSGAALLGGVPAFAM